MIIGRIERKEHVDVEFVLVVVETHKLQKNNS